MDLTVTGVIIGVIGLLIGILSLFITIRHGKNPSKRKMKKLKAVARLNCINKILAYQHNFVLNLQGSAFIFMPNGEIIFGAGWVNYEWQELLAHFVEKQNRQKATIASIGGEYYLADLITGQNIRIPLDPQKEMTIEKSGVQSSHIYMFIPFNS